MAHDWNSSTWGLRQEDGTFGSSLGYSDPDGLSSHDFVILVLVSAPGSEVCRGCGLLLRPQCSQQSFPKLLSVVSSCLSS